MTAEEIAEERRKHNAEYQKRYRQSRKDDPSYWEKRHEYSKKYRESHSEKVKAQKAAYAKRKREQAKLNPKPQTKPTTDKPKDKPKKVDTVTPPIEIQPVWHSPTVTVVLAESHKEDRTAIIENRKGSEKHLRLKIIVAADNMDELKSIARRIGFRTFQDTPKTF